MSCFHNDRERSEGKIGESAGIDSAKGIASSFSRVAAGNIASRCTCVASIISDTEERALKSTMGYFTVRFNADTWSMRIW